MESLLGIEEKAKYLAQETVKIVFETDKLEEFKHLKSYSEKIEELLLETKEWLENGGFCSAEDRHLVIEMISNMKLNVDFLATQAQVIKSSETLLCYEVLLSPGLANKLERLSEDIEEIAENIEIGLSFGKELSELELLLKEYSKVSAEVDLKKKFGKI